MVRAINEMGDKDCTLALNFGGPSGDDDNVPAKIYEQPELRQPDPTVLILEAHVQANPKPKVTWLCNGDFVKESDRKFAKLEARPDGKNRWNCTLTILVSIFVYFLRDFLRLSRLKVGKARVAQWGENPQFIQKFTF